MLGKEIYREIKNPEGSKAEEFPNLLNIITDFSQFFKFFYQIDTMRKLAS